MTKTSLPKPKAQKTYLPFRELGGDVNWVEYGGSWYAGPFEACLGEPGGYTYFFVLKWLPRHPEREGLVELRVVIPSLWNADALYQVLEPYELSAQGLDIRDLLDSGYTPGHVIYSQTVGHGITRTAAFRAAKERALVASSFLGSYIDGNYGWDRVAGDSPLEQGMLGRELKRQARLGIVLALTDPSDGPDMDEYVMGQWIGQLIDEFDFAEPNTRARYKALQKVSQHWLERWFAQHVKGFMKGVR